MYIQYRQIKETHVLSMSSSTNNNSNVHGQVKSGWDTVRCAFEENLEQGLDIGASLCIYYQGQCVVDLSGGWKDPQTKTEPYTLDTLQLVFSASKGVMAAAIALCVERGWLDYDTPVAKYWPEFAVNGKENITVGDVLSHRAGLPCVDEELTIDDICHLPRVTSLLAAQKPHWKPGTMHGYHEYTFGFLAGELIRRVDPHHRSYGQFIHDELDSEFYVGAPNDDVEARVAPLIRKQINIDKSDSSPMDLLVEKTITLNGAIPVDSTDSSETIFNDIRFHQMDLPSINGITNARSLARIYAQLIGDINDNNGNEKKRLISENTLTKATENITPPGESDRIVFGVASTFSKSGFQTYGYTLDVLGDDVFGHIGMGGSCALAYPPEQLAYAFVCNHINSNISVVDERNIRLLEAVQEVIHEITKMA